MRLYSQKERDDAGLAIELIKQTLMSQQSSSTKGTWMKAYKKLHEAQKILIESAFYSKDFDPSLASY